MDSPQNNTELLKCGSSCSHCFVLCIYFTIRLQSIPHVLMSFIKQTKKKKSHDPVCNIYPVSFLLYNVSDNAHIQKHNIYRTARSKGRGMSSVTSNCQHSHQQHGAHSERLTGLQPFVFLLSLCIRRAKFNFSTKH